MQIHFNALVGIEEILMFLGSANLWIYRYASAQIFETHIGGGREMPELDNGTNNG